VEWFREFGQAWIVATPNEKVVTIGIIILMAICLMLEILYLRSTNREKKLNKQINILLAELKKPKDSNCSCSNDRSDITENDYG